MFKKFISYYKPHKVLFTLDMLASLFVSMITIFYPVITRRMMNDLIPNKKFRDIIWAGLLLLGLYLLRMGLNYFIQYMGHVMGVRMQAQMRSELFAHLEKQPFSYYDDHETGELMSRLTTDLFEVSELAHHGPETVIITSITVIVSFVYLATINIWLTLIIFICAPVLVWVSLKSRFKQRAAFRERRVSLAKINASIESSLSGIRVTKAFNNIAKEQEKFEVGNQAFQDASRKAYRALAQFHSSTTFITDFFNVVVLIAGGIFLYRGAINFGDYSAFILSINLFLTPINTLIRWMEDFQNGASGFERFVEILDTEPEQDAPDAADAGRLRGEIVFDHVSASYENDIKVLDDVSLKIPAGKTFALVGPSGGGKTTMCHLIPHFYEIAEGRILLDGTDINSLTRTSVRANIGIVQQDVFLFNASIKENILYGRLDATDEEVYEAAKRANIHDYILSMEHGYDTVIGERGVKLSGGQRQRLCIARVFLKNPPILILDEATSALDNVTEMLIQQALDELCKGRTTLVVAHRLSTIKRADEIAVVERGRIAERGTHEELMHLQGIYAKLYEQQFREEA